MNISLCISILSCRKLPWDCTDIIFLFLSFLLFLSLFNPSLLCFFFSFLIIFSHFLHSVGAVKWPIVKEQTVCVWDISCWFSGTLAWWMARQKTPNNSWFASRETFSLRMNNVQHSHRLCSASNDDFHCFAEDETLSPVQFQTEGHQSTSAHFIQNSFFLVKYNFWADTL